MDQAIYVFEKIGKKNAENVPVATWCDILAACLQAARTAF